MALSITWAAVGVLVTAAGLLLKQAELRTAGLAVLALASVKVFVFDLSSLDIAYRVITLIVLGVLLIASALAWTRLKPEADPGAPGDDSVQAGRVVKVSWIDPATGEITETSQRSDARPSAVSDVCHRGPGSAAAAAYDSATARRGHDGG